ncbi:ATP synthase F1 subunit delta [Oscillatoria salina]|uniref:ATP synthase F1 subunit delta n=1 Tax=Oscillatoria salina TaxID=331517 RepID=UPI0013BAD096|nr:ATP synthase F1 subunit delta [Oscillatoria salina]MBZ8179365.1 F0F1 ATP synthase subunit delta [Oscillatoria salina IIICB1]NET87545.1 F0F1 ATP synthase subunit delta [Kamptonema sp. SIO1D9]
MKKSLVSAEIVEPYAEALMSLAQQRDLTEPFGEQLRSLLELLENSSELNEFLSNPVVKDEDKKAVLRRIGGEEFDPLLMNFLMLLVDKRRIIFIEEICQQYLELLRKLNNAVLAEVSSAAELNDEQKQAVSNKVKAMTGASAVELKTKIDPDLIGGVIIRVGSQVLDASIRGQLRRISLSLKSAA